MKETEEDVLKKCSTGGIIAEYFDTRSLNKTQFKRVTDLLWMIMENILLFNMIWQDFGEKAHFL